MPAADRGREGSVKLTYAQAAEIYARAEQRAALLRATAAPPKAVRSRRRGWKVALPALAVAAVLVGVAFWAHESSPSGGNQSFDALAMVPTVVRPQPAVGRVGTVDQLAPTLGFTVLLPHTPLANPRLLYGAWSGELGSTLGGVTPTDGIVLDFRSTGLRVIEVPDRASPELGLDESVPAPGGMAVRSAIVRGLIVRVVALSGHPSAAALAAVLRSLR
jgi:hypothetical protein